MLRIVITQTCRALPVLLLRLFTDQCVILSQQYPLEDLSQYEILLLPRTGSANLPNASSPGQLYVSL